MNLTTNPWIPVVWEDGKADKVSLLDAFLKGDRIRDLAVRPHERIALMRLLICVAQAGLDGPKDHDEWQKCRSVLPGKAADYLVKWKHAFELFGDGQRFLQVANVKPTKRDATEADEINSPSKLDFALATGNNSTLFDNAGGSERLFTAHSLALSLLTFQNFSPAGRIGDVKWDGCSMGGSSKRAPCVVKAMLHTYLKRPSLLDTVWANMLSRDQIGMLGCKWGVPVWENMPCAPTSGEATANATSSYLGRLVPLTRAIHLSHEGTSMLMGTALEYDPEWREVATTWVIREREGKPARTCLGASLTKSVWREAHSIAVLVSAERQMLGGPLAFTSLGKGEGVDVWCGALVADKSKLLDTVESVLHLPASMFGDAGQRLYGQGVEQAQRWNSRINRAISVCRRELHDELDKAEFRQRGMSVKQKAAAHYWTAIEQKVPLLLALVDDPSTLRSEGADKDNWAGTAWGKALAGAARDAYELACPHETPRQLKAYALGLSVLFRPVETHEHEPDTEEATP